MSYDEDYRLQIQETQVSMQFVTTSLDGVKRVEQLANAAGVELVEARLVPARTANGTEHWTTTISAPKNVDFAQGLAAMLLVAARVKGLTPEEILSGVRAGTGFEQQLMRPAA